jgi:splicing factor 45
MPCFGQFEDVESASKALEDLQGRFFGGRSVRVAYFDEGRFERLELAPQPGEFGPG